MQRSVILGSPHIDLFRLFFAPFDHLEKSDQRLSLIIIEIEGRLIGYPAMNASSTGVDPEQVSEAESLCSYKLVLRYGNNMLGFAALPRSEWCSTLTAAAINPQHLRQIFLSVQQVRISS